MQRLMSDSNKTEAERAVQREFRKIIVGGACSLLAAAILISGAWLDRLPERIESGHRVLPLEYETSSLGFDRVGPFRVVGAWRLRVGDARFGGVSAMAIDAGGFLALSDSGVVARFPRPGSVRPVIALDELPDGPGNPGFKYNRDSEALAADPAGRGWWVAFENRDALWLYDPKFDRVLERRRIDHEGLGRNRGVEAMVAEGDGLLLFPERGGVALSAGGRRLPIRGVSGWISDAVVLPDGRLLVANRTPTGIGLSNRLAVLERDRIGFHLRAEWPIPVGRLDNIEALAVEARPDGALRLWMMTDNNLQQRRPTLLIALELRPRPAR